MQDLNDKVTGGVLTAVEWNEVPSEIQNVIEGLGITLSSGDLNQLGKSIAGYVANGNFYTDSGIADAYVLSVVGIKQRAPAYTNGFEISFLPGNTNTGGSTVNVASLGVITLKTVGGGSVPAGYITAAEITTAIFDGTDFILSNPLSKTILPFDNLSEALSSTIILSGNQINLEDRITGNGGGAMWNAFPAGTFTVGAAIFDVFDHDTLPLQLKLRDSEKQGPKAWGLILDGIADDSDAFIAWANGTDSPGHDIGTARITKNIPITSPWIYKPGNQFIVFPDLGTETVRVLQFTTSDVDIEFAIDATGGTFTGGVGNKYAVFLGDSNGATKYTNAKVKVKIKNFEYFDGNTGDANLITGHGVFIENYDNIKTDDSQILGTSGAAIFARDCTTLSIRRVVAQSNVWYPINIEDSVDNFAIEHCYIDQTGKPNGVFWGGGINLQSQQAGGGLRNKNGSVRFNVMTGFYSYGSVIRCNSAENVEIAHNNLIDVEVGAITLANDLTAIRVDTRGISTVAQNGPCDHINVHHNKLVAGLSGTATMVAIYVSNQWQSARDPARSIYVNHNEITSTNLTRFWESGVIFHGFEGGIEDIECFGNFGQTNMQTGPIVDGAVGFVANNVQGSIISAQVGGNRFIDLGTPASTFQLGLGIGQFVDEIFVTRPNTFNNYWLGVRTFTNAGPTLDRIDNNHYIAIGSANELFAVNPSRFDVTLKGSATYDPPSLASGATAFTDVTVTGAAIGDRVEATFSLNQDGVIFTGYVRTLNSVRVYLENKDAAVKDLASGTLSVEVFR